MQQYLGLMLLLILSTYPPATDMRLGPFVAAYVVGQYQCPPIGFKGFSLQKPR